MQLLRFDNKGIRARVIAKHLREAGKFDNGVVCLTCGNAANALRNEGLQVVELGAQGALKPNRWLAPAEVARAFPTHFDATSGHLPVYLMAEIGKAYKKELGALPYMAAVPSGSGETVVCLALAYPGNKFVAVYDNEDPACVYNDQAPLNGLVALLCAGVEVTGHSA